MGILRSDRVSGLGGANAINGSTHFTGSSDTGNYLRIDTGATEDFTFGTGDFTIEFWVNSQASGFQQHFYDGRGTTNSQRLLIYMDNNSTMYYFDGTANRIQSSSALATNEWVHVALVRASATTKLYWNGTQTGSTHTSDTVDFLAPPQGNAFIGSNGGTDGIEPSGGGYFNGFLSNYRIVKGTGVYTANFTIPNTRLAAIDGTVLLTCTSSGNVSKTEGGNDVQPSAKNSNSTPPVASKFSPNSPVGFSTTTDVGSQYGITFGDNTKFDTLSYMVPPSGNTRERGRGRGVFGGGYTSVPSGAAVKRIYYIQIDSMGTSAEFGDTNKAAAWGQGGCSSSTRGLFTGGTNPTNLNTIDYITIATTSNASDFGDLSIGHGYTASCSNNTRGLTGGGRGGSPTARLAQIDYNTIATLGNGADFGDLTQSRMGLGAVASSTRAVFTGGNGSPADPSTVYNNIDYVEFATTGNATDFGDMTDEHTYHGSCSSSTRGIIYGGDTSYGPTVLTNIIEYVTIASTGNGNDFGDVRDDGAHAHGTSNSIRGVFAGATNPYRNSIDFVTIATTGNGVDWGDLPISSGSYAYAAGLSDSHGGLS